RALPFFPAVVRGGLAAAIFGSPQRLAKPYSRRFHALKAFTSAFLRGIGHIPGAVVRAMVLRTLAALAASSPSTPTCGHVGAEYKDVFAFIVLILILIFRPKGLLGEKVREEGA